MLEIYIVTAEYPSNYSEIVGLFSSRAIAEIVDELNQDDDVTIHIDSIVVDNAEQIKSLLMKKEIVDAAKRSGETYSKSMSKRLDVQLAQENIRE